LITHDYSYKQIHRLTDKPDKYINILGGCKKNNRYHGPGDEEGNDVDLYRPITASTLRSYRPSTV